MKLLSPGIRSLLSANFEHCVRNPRFDPFPLVRLFNPTGRAVWLVSELYADDDTLYGLADLGFGCPELGIFSLREIEAIDLPLGLKMRVISPSRPGTACRSGPRPLGLPGRSPMPPIS